MKCWTPMCDEAGTEPESVTHPDGSVTEDWYCPDCHVQYLTTLREIERGNAETEARWDRDADARRGLYGPR